MESELENFTVSMPTFHRGDWFTIHCRFDKEVFHWRNCRYGEIAERFPKDATDESFMGFLENENYFNVIGSLEAV